MNTRPDSERQRMLEVLDARWAVGQATKKRSTFSLKLAAMAASGALALAVMAPGNVAYADEGAQADDAAQPDAAALVADDEADEAEEADADAAEAAEEPEEAVAEAAEPEATEPLAADAAAAAEPEVAAEPEAAAADEPLAVDAAEAEPALASAPAAVSPSAEAKASTPAAAPTLKDLIDALADGGTLTLDDDMDYDAGSNGTISIKKAVTIDLAGHALSYSGDELFNITKAGSVLLKGGSISGDNELVEYNKGTLSLSDMDVDGVSDYLAYYNYGTLAIDGSTIDSDYDIVEYNYGDLNVSGSTIVTDDDLAYYNYGGTISISDSMIVVDDDLVDYMYGGTLAISGTDIDAEGDYLVDDNNGGDVTITGGTIECSTVVDDNYGGTLTLDGAEVSCSYAVICCNYGDLVVKSTSGAGIVSEYLVSSSYEGTSVTIESGDFTCKDEAIVSYVAEGASVTIEDGTFDCREGFCSNYGDVTINGGTFVCSEEFVDDSYEGSTVTINGGTYDCGDEWLDNISGTVYISNATVTVDDPDAEFIDLSDPGKASFANGTVTCDVDYDGEGHQKLTAVEDSSASNTTFLLNGHLDLMECAKDGDLVKLTGDIVHDDGEIDLDADVTLDCNGHKLTNTGDELFIVEEGGTLTLVNADIYSDSYDIVEYNYGKVVVKSTSGDGIVSKDDFVCDNYGDVVIEGGNFKCDDVIVDATEEGGSLTVKGGTFESGSYAFDDIYGTADIYDADVTSGSACIYVSDTGVVNVHGGTYTSEDDVISNSGKVTLTGGTFTATDDSGDGCLYGSGDYIIPEGYYADPSDWKETSASKVVIRPVSITVDFYSEGELYKEIEGDPASLSMPTDPTKKGCGFLFWQDADGNHVASLKGLTRDTKLYAVFNDEQRTITFDDKGVKTSEQVAIASDLGKAAGLDRKDTGDGFIGWLLDGVLVDETTDRVVADDITLVASYKKAAEDVVVTIDDNGTKTAVSVPAGTTFSEFFAAHPELVRAMGAAAGDFYGWMIDEYTDYNSYDARDAAFETRVDSESPMTIAKDLTLKAEYITTIAKASTYEQLLQALADKVEFIELTDAIETPKTVDIKYDCTIFSRDSSICGLVRAEGFTDSLVHVNNDIEATLDNILVDGKNLDAASCAIHVEYYGTLYLTKSTVQNNINTKSSAGGIRSDWGVLSISESTIQNNKGGEAGGIGAYGVATTIVASDILNNTARSDGGGIYWLVVRSSGRPIVGREHLSVVESVIDGNTAGRDGGAAYLTAGWSTDSVSADFTDSKITNNKAEYDAGGLYISDAIVNLNGNTQVSYNAAQNGGGIGSAAGLRADTCQIIVNDTSEISFNKATENGGGVCLDELYLEMNDDSSIHDNTAGENGGGVYASDYGMSQLGGTIYNNHADGEGGGVYVYHFDASDDKGFDAGMIYDNTADVAGDDINSEVDEYLLYSTQPSRNLGDGKSGELGTVTVEQIDGYHKATVDDGISVSWGDWYLDPDSARYSGTDGKTMPVSVGHTTVKESLYPSLKAIWCGLLLAYDANFGDDPEYAFDKQAYTEGDTASVQNYRFSERPGYIFKGWNTKADGTGTSYIPGQDFLMAGSAVLYAQWACQVAYDAQPDESYGAPEDYAVPTDDTEYAEGGAVSVADLPTTGQGWAKHPDGRTIPGTWSFVGTKTSETPVPADWACADWADGDFNIDRSTLVAGHWSFAPDTYKVTYEVAGDAKYGSPEGVVVPTDKNAYIFDDVVSVASNLASAQGWAILDGQKILGKWVFSAWDKAGSFLIEGDTLIRGAWTFVPGESPEPEPTPEANPAPAPEQASYDVQAVSPKTADSQTAIPAAAAVALGACAMALEALRRKKRDM